MGPFRLRQKQMLLPLLLSAPFLKGTALGCGDWQGKVMLLPLLKESKGTVMNVSSIAGDLYVPCMGAYCASKSAVTNSRIFSIVRRHSNECAMVHKIAVRRPAH